MPRGVYNRATAKGRKKRAKVEEFPQPTEQQVDETLGDLEQVNEKADRVEEIVSELRNERLNAGGSILKQGQLLTELQELLPRGFFKYVKVEIPSLSTATVTRYIRAYRNAQKLPPAVLKVALARGVDITSDDLKKPFGKFSTVVKKFPVPKPEAGKDDVEHATAENWLESVLSAFRLANRRKATRALNPDEAMKNCFQFDAKQFHRIPEQYRTAEFYVELMGYLLTEAGHHQQVLVAPRPLREDLVAAVTPKKRGRPVEEITIRGKKAA